MVRIALALIPYKETLCQAFSLAALRTFTI